MATYHIEDASGHLDFAKRASSTSAKHSRPNAFHLKLDSGA